MIEVLQALAIRLAWLRIVALLVIVGFAALFLYAALADNAPDSFFTSGLAGTIWGLLLFTFLATFPAAPAPPTDEQSGWQRFVIRLRRIGYGILALTMLALTAVSASLTLKLIKSLSA